MTLDQAVSRLFDSAENRDSFELPLEIRDIEVVNGELIVSSFREIARPYDTLFAIAGWTILLSVLLHGFSALPLARWYSKRLKTASPNLPELVEMPDLEPHHGQITSLPQTSVPLAGSSEEPR